MFRVVFQVLLVPVKYRPTSSFLYCFHLPICIISFAGYSILGFLCIILHVIVSIKIKRV